MIGRLAGRLIFRGPDHVLIDVGGVGYMVYVNERTLATLPAVGEAAALHTDLLVREDLLQLFGFLTPVEKEWHRLLMSVQGIGARASMAILGALGPDGVGRAIALGDVSAIRAAPGVGPKIAQRVTIELKDKAPALMAMGQAPDIPDTAPVIVPDTSTAATTPQPVAGPGAQAEALSALSNLGYSPADASRAVAQVAGEAGDDTATLIRLALKRLAPA
ncbi:Holliday junction branch migration protein RuvA [Palleronia sp. LCG004]|uniref:Holliday junction branch migration protein RuvA n=1 Tax=Palleronia sp. LCG004 TaxID=3079304 RepID=UPI002943EEB3|nr:Holliday junction branch migration protein RuvA [Palleronia sp. LCG004]WOI55832.1 Holliday junction branch migration protein RuvA [Palleronia sp. LCG004]